MFQSIRKLSLVIFFLSILLLAFIAILGVWEVVQDEILSRSLASMGLLTFSSLLILAVSLEREKKWIFDPQRTQKGSTAGGVIKFIVFAIIFLWLGGWLLRVLLYSF